MPSNFRSCPRTISWLGSVAQLVGTPPLPNSNHGTPRPPPSLAAPHKCGGLPSLALPPSDAHVACWCPGSLSEGRPCPVHCPRGILALQAPFPTGRPCPLHYPGPSWALGLLWPTSPVPGVPTKQNSPFHSHTPSRSMNSCTPPNGFRAFSRHQQNDLLFVNLTTH